MGDPRSPADPDHRPTRRPLHQRGARETIEKTTCLAAHEIISPWQQVKKEEEMASNQYDTIPSWVAGRTSSQYDTGKNRHSEPGAAFLGPRLWDQPINLPFQLFPSDSQQQQDVSKQQQESGFNKQQSCFQ